MEPTPPPYFPMFTPPMSIESQPPPTGPHFDESFSRSKWKEGSDHSLVERPPDQPSLSSQTQSKIVDLLKDSGHEQQRPDVLNLLRVLENADCDHEDAYQAYLLLPAPGISHLSEEQIRLFLRRLSTSQKKSPQEALHYLSVVDEMASRNIPMTQGEWNSAIAFCGQCFAWIGSREVEEALLTWKKMEYEAKIHSSNVTFNILFDMAAKAGKFVLADMILKEMRVRGLEYNRFFRVGNIYFNGLRGDGDGVRRAYGELVEAGEVVDTVVMNCVIAALISAGELASAENVYDRMKRLISNYAGKLLPSPRKWQEERGLGRLFDRIARNSRQEACSKKDEARLSLLNERISIVPNMHTFNILIEHHVSHTGDLHRISAILSDMQSYGVAINGRVFLKIFKGFSKHGQQPLTAWTLHRLESVWSSLLVALDEGKEDVWVGKWMTIWIVRAFNQCAGRSWALHVWEKLQARQRPEHEDLENAYAILSDILKAD